MKWYRWWLLVWSVFCCCFVDFFLFFFKLQLSEFPEVLLILRNFHLKGFLFQAAANKLIDWSSVSCDGGGISSSPSSARLWEQLTIEEGNTYIFPADCISYKSLSRFGFILLRSNFRSQNQKQVGFVTLKSAPLIDRTNVSLSICKAEVVLVLVCLQSELGESEEHRCVCQEQTLAGSLGGVEGERGCLRWLLLQCGCGCALVPARVGGTRTFLEELLSAQKAGLNVYLQSSLRCRQSCAEMI